MKKYISFFITALMCFTSVSCHKDALPADETTESRSPTAETVAPPHYKTENEIDWGQVPTSEEADALYRRYMEESGCHSSDFGVRKKFPNFEMVHNSWTLTNALGQTLYCKDGLLYGDMPYYAKGYRLDGSLIFYVDPSEEFVFTPLYQSKSSVYYKDYSDGGMWVYDQSQGELIPVFDEEAYEEYAKVPYSGGMYLYNGKGVESVRFTEGQITVYGEFAEYGFIRVVKEEPLKVVFEKEKSVG